MDDDGANMATDNDETKMESGDDETTSTRMMMAMEPTWLWNQHGYNGAKTATGDDATKYTDGVC